MKLKLLEATPERRQEVQQSGVTPTVLLRRWAYLAYAVAKFVVGLLAVGFAYFFAYGLVIKHTPLGGAGAGLLFILGMIPVSRLFYVWAFPVRY